MTHAYEIVLQMVLSFLSGAELVCGSRKQKARMNCQFSFTVGGRIRLTRSSSIMYGKLVSESLKAHVNNYFCTMITQENL